jgi:hypothetical protein
VLDVLDDLGGAEQDPADPAEGLRERADEVQYVPASPASVLRPTPGRGAKPQWTSGLGSGFARQLLDRLRRRRVLRRRHSVRRRPVLRDVRRPRSRGRLRQRLRLRRLLTAGDDAQDLAAKRLGDSPHAPRDPPSRRRSSASRTRKCRWTGAPGQVVRSAGSVPPPAAVLPRSFFHSRDDLEELFIHERLVDHRCAA